MVRLLHALFADALLGELTFQSHNGAIAAQPSGRSMRNASSFQSHNGAIAALAPHSLGR